MVSNLSNFLFLSLQRHRDRRYVPTETVDSDSDLPPYDVRIQPYPCPEPSDY